MTNDKSFQSYSRYIVVITAKSKNTLEKFKAIIKHSHVGRDLSSTLWQLVHIEVEGHAALQAEEAAAAVLLEDRLLCQIGCFAVEHQQVPVQKPDSTA